MNLKDENTINSKCCDNCNLKRNYNNIKWMQENLIHDIKTPLNIIYSAIDDIEKSKHENQYEDIMDSIKLIKAYWFKITKMINDVSDFHKINNGTILPNYINIDMVTLLKDILYSTKHLANRKNISIEFKSKLKHKKMATDKALIERIILNLLSNAYKFTNRDGKVNLEFIVYKDNVCIKVIDTGIGISKEQIEFIFSRYVLNKTPQNKAGTGLGLSIVREFIILLNGDVNVKSSPAGTEFEILLPYFLIESQKRATYNYNDFYTENIVQIELSDVGF